MLAVNPDAGGESPQDAAYNLVGAGTTSRVVGDNAIQDVVVVTAQSKMFLVTYTWFVEVDTWKADGAPGIVGLKTSQVNVICAHDHVIGFRTQQDQDASRLLINNAIITVGTDDGLIQDEVSQRMDQIGLPSVFAKIDAAWSHLQSFGV